eukprot:5230917-Amphidinium_carterae.2
MVAWIPSTLAHWLTRVTRQRDHGGMDTVFLGRVENRAQPPQRIPVHVRCSDSKCSHESDLSESPPSSIMIQAMQKVVKRRSFVKTCDDFLSFK